MVNFAFRSRHRHAHCSVLHSTRPTPIAGRCCEHEPKEERSVGLGEASPPSQNVHPIGSWRTSAFKIYTFESLEDLGDNQGLRSKHVRENNKHMVERSFNATTEAALISLLTVITVGRWKKASILTRASLTKQWCTREIKAFELTYNMHFYCSLKLFLNSHSWKFHPHVDTYFATLFYQQSWISILCTTLFVSRLIKKLRDSDRFAACFHRAPAEGFFAFILCSWFMINILMKSQIQTDWYFLIPLSPSPASSAICCTIVSWSRYGWKNCICKLVTHSIVILSPQRHSSA